MECLATFAKSYSSTNEPMNLVGFAKRRFGISSKANAQRTFARRARSNLNEQQRVAGLDVAPMLRRVLL
jgi:hypothetical protein